MMLDLEQTLERLVKEYRELEQKLADPAGTFYMFSLARAIIRGKVGR